MKNPFSVRSSPRHGNDDMKTAAPSSSNHSKKKVKDVVVVSEKKRKPGFSFRTGHHHASEETAQIVSPRNSKQVVDHQARDTTSSHRTGEVRQRNLVVNASHETNDTGSNTSIETGSQNSVDENSSPTRPTVEDKSNVDQETAQQKQDGQTPSSATEAVTAQDENSLNQSKQGRHLNGTPRSLSKPTPILVDSFLYDSVFSGNDLLWQRALEQIRDEAHWSILQHKKALNFVSVQGDKDIVDAGDSGSEVHVEPCFRYPIDKIPPLHPWSPTVDKIRKVVSEVTGHQFNHAVISLYRNKREYQDETASTTLDQRLGTPCVILALGASQTIELKPKKIDASGRRQPSPRPSTKVDLTHSSVFSLGWETNSKFTHRVVRTSRHCCQASSVDGDHTSTCSLASHSVATRNTTLDGEEDSLIPPPDGTRILIMLRNVATYKTEEGRIFGQGASVQNLEQLQEHGPLISDSTIGETPSGSMALLHKSFEREIRHADYSWTDLYGSGFDVIPSGALSSKGKSRRHKGRISESAESSSSSSKNIESEGIAHPKVDPLPGDRIALLAVDLQNDFLDDDPQLFATKMGSTIPHRRSGLLKRISELASEVRSLGGLVVFVNSRYGAWSSPEKSDHDRNAGAHMDHVECCAAGSFGAEMHPEAAKLVQDQDLVMCKEWYSAFMRTILHEKLQRLGVGRLVVAGLTTNHSCAATARSAARLGYSVYLSRDGSTQLDPSLQEETERTLSPYCRVLEAGVSIQEMLHPQPDMQALDALALDASPMPVNGFQRISGLGAGDSVVVPNFLGKNEAIGFESESFRALANDANAFVTKNVHGHFPVYRDGMTMQPWDPDYRALQLAQLPEAFRNLKQHVEEQAGHSFNWCQLSCVSHDSPARRLYGNFRDTRDGSYAAVVTFSRAAIVELSPKNRNHLSPQRIDALHNSLLLLGPSTLEKMTSEHMSVEDDVPLLEFVFRDLATFCGVEESNRLGFPAVYGRGTQFVCMEDAHKEVPSGLSGWQCVAGAVVGASMMALLQPRARDQSSSPISNTAAVFGSIAATATSALIIHGRQRKAWIEREKEKRERIVNDLELLK